MKYILTHPCDEPSCHFVENRGWVINIDSPEHLLEVIKKYDYDEFSRIFANNPAIKDENEALLWLLRQLCRIA